MPERDDVLVVGGGPAGSATALRLARLGHRVRLIDRAVFPREKACAEYLSPATVRCLEALAIPDDWRGSVDATISATAVHGAEGSHLIGGFGAPQASHGTGIRRSILDAVILNGAALAGVTIEHGSVRNLITDGSQITGVTLQNASGNIFSRHARVVVGADGLRSVIARRTGMRVHGRLRRMAFSAHMSGIEGITSVTEMHVGRHGYLGLNTLGGGVTNVSLVVSANYAEKARGDATKFFLQSLIEIVPTLRPRLAEARVVREVLVTGPFHASCRRVTGNGFLLVGDAAEFFDPFTGDGIHSALVGAVLAADNLNVALQQRGEVRDRNLTAYRHARRHAFLGKWLIERLIGYGMLAPKVFDRAVARVEKRGMADLLIGATGHEISPWRILNPIFLTRMLA